MTRPHNWRRSLETPRLFLILILFCLIASVAWASVALIDRVVRVEGRIIPAGRSQQIQHLEGGIVAAISTKEGASVKRNDLLLTIDDTMAGANLAETKTKLAAQRAKAIRLEAELKDAASVSFPPDLASLPVAEGERGLFAARRAKLNQEISIHTNMIQQRKAELDEVSERRTQLNNELNIAHKRSEMVIGMAAKNAASKLEVLDAQSREQKLQTDMGDAENSVPALKAAISGEEARVASVKAEFHATAQNELTTALAEIDQLKQAATAETDRVKRTEIRAPADGVINRIAVNTVGGVVKPGEILIELIPTTKEILIEAKAAPRDRGYLRPGLDATIRVSAYDIGEFGVLKGQVTDVSADTVQDARGDPYYRVNILVSELPPRYADKPMIPGMMVTADVITGHHTVLSHLVSPLSKFTYNMFRDSR